MNILAFESSCDETAVAVVRDGRTVLSDAILSQADMHALYGGVVPEIASRKHVEAIAGLTDQALADAGLTKSDVDAVAVTYAPGLIGAVLAFLLVVVCVKAPAESERKDLEESAGAKENPEKHGVLWGYLAPLSLLSAVMFFLVGGSTDAFNSFTIPFLSVENGWTEGAANLCATIAAAGMLVGGTAMGLVLARTKDKGLLLFIDMLVCAIGLFLWFNLDIGVVGTYVIAFVLGCFLGAAPTVFFAMAPEVARSPKTVGAATAVVVLGQNGGTLAVPAIVGMILDSAGYGAAAMAMGGLSLAACVICLLVFRRIYNKSIRSTRE